jgi:hypothetical protein
MRGITYVVLQPFTLGDVQIERGKKFVCEGFMHYKSDLIEAHKRGMRLDDDEYYIVLRDESDRLYDMSAEDITKYFGRMPPPRNTSNNRAANNAFWNAVRRFGVLSRGSNGSKSVKKGKSKR